MERINVFRPWTAAKKLWRRFIPHSSLTQRWLTHVFAVIVVAVN